MRITIRNLQEMKERGEKIAMLTAYDYPTARMVDEGGVPIILVGDSVGNNVLGYQTTVPVTMDDMIHHLRAVLRGAKKAHIVCDMMRGPLFAAGLAVQARQGVNVSAGWQLGMVVDYNSANCSVRQITIDHTHYETLVGVRAATELYGRVFRPTVHREVYAYDVEARSYRRLTGGGVTTLGSHSADGSLVAFTRESGSAPADLFNSSTRLDRASVCSASSFDTSSLMASGLSASGTSVAASSPCANAAWPGRTASATAINAAGKTGFKKFVMAVLRLDVFEPHKLTRHPSRAKKQAGFIGSQRWTTAPNPPAVRV